MLTRVTIFASVLVTALQVTTLASLAAQWTSRARHGLRVRLLVPAGLFQEIEGDGKPSFHYFRRPTRMRNFKWAAGITELAAPLKASNNGSSRTQAATTK